MSALPWPGRPAHVPLTGLASVGEIDQALRKRPWWRVALPPQLEHTFQHDTLSGRLTLLQRSGWMALLIFDCFLLVDWLMANDVFVYSILIRLVFFTPAGIAMLIAAKHHQADWVMRNIADVCDVIVMCSGWLAGACLALILLKSHSPLAMYYHAGYLVVIIYGILVQPLGFRWAVLYGAGMLLMHIGSVQAGQPMPEPLRWSLLHLMVSTTALADATCCCFESKG
jgi:hypothetical protein